MRECPMCAGTGKIRDDGTSLSPFSAGTYFAIDPEIFRDFDWLITCGT